MRLSETGTGGEVGWLGMGLWVVLDLLGRKSYVTVLVGQEVATGFNHL